MPPDPLDIVSDLIERHVSAEETAPAAINIVSALSVLVAGGTSHTPAPAARSAARRRLKDAAMWFDGRSAQVAALINAIAALDPPNRDHRKAVLTAAWSDLLAE
ncbi:hypothetical protein [Methylobacterium radiotolerans]|uniref:hypothetical protein n=1 Tax=Methylobacterium radiotolerans TaxID=31998 RepID=UPI001F457B62|nr:hypothetical protein [Methylobacterium radiotolerans]UIY45589.1 hypothetical protein LZ599_31310 [Methylobacterium radiotolerans]